MATIEVLVGMIASGKSGYAAERAAEGAIVVSGDAITLALHGGHYDHYCPTLRPVYAAVEAATIHGALAAGRDVVIDRPNLSKASRAIYARLAGICGATAVAVVFPMAAPGEHARRRHAADPRGLTLERWIAVATRHAGQYESVDRAAEGFSHVFYRPAD
jgi:predicted kinase